MSLNVPFREVSLTTGILRQLQKAFFLIIMRDLLTKLCGIALFSRQQQVNYMEDAHRTLSTAEPGVPQQLGTNTSPGPGPDQHAHRQSAAEEDMARVAIRRGPAIVCAWRGAQALCCCFTPSDARKTGKAAVTKHCTQVLCYRKGSDCCDLCTVHLHKPTSSGFTGEKSMSPSHVEDNHLAHKLRCPGKSTALLSSYCALYISTKLKNRANVYKAPFYFSPRGVQTYPSK